MRYYADAIEGSAAEIAAFALSTCVGVPLLLALVLSLLNPVAFY